jgi:parallel beta-helix repeat protein
MKTALTAFALFGALALASAQTIPNPSFESNSFTTYPGYISANGPIVGWSTTDPGSAGLNPAGGNPTNYPFADNGTIPDGTNVAFIQSAPDSSLYTTISNLTIGQTYKVNFRVNARAAFGGNPGPPMPNLKIAMNGSNIINTAITNVGGSNPYRYFAFDFTAASNNETMSLSNDSSGDQTVLVDDFSNSVRNSGWSYAAWSNDASSGIVATNIYTHAYHFGANNVTAINGVTFTGIAVTNPSLNSVFSTAGLPRVFNNDNNNLTTGTGGSAVLAHDFVFGGTNESITINGLIPGNSYVATIYSVGFDSTGSRAATFNVGSDRLTVNQDQFGDHNGIRVSYAYVATSNSITLTYVPLQGGGVTFHTYGFSNAQLVNSNTPPLVVTTSADSGSGSLRQVISNALPGETITFDPSLSGQNINVYISDLLIRNNLTIDASALPGGLQISQVGTSSRVFEVAANTVVTLNSLTIQNGIADVGGGIYVNSGASLTLANCTLSGNSSTSGGGGIYVNSGASLTLTNCTLSGNTDNNFGGGIYVSSGASLTLVSCTLSGNSSTNNGGGIYLNSGASNTLVECTLSNNSDGGFGNGGGGIYVTNASLTLTNCTLSGNTDGNEGGGIFVDSNASLTLEDCTLSNNSDFGFGNGGGGGIYFNSGASLMLANCTLSSNTDYSGFNGGGIYVQSGTLTINGSTFSGNSVPGGIGYGGGIFVFSGTTTINGSTFSGNSAPGGGGGGIYVQNSTLTINGSTFSGNSAPGGGYGGGIYVFNGANTINNSTISSNSGDAFGGGLYLSGPSFLTNTVVAGNFATNGPDIYGPFSGANNLTNGNPLLAPLGNYGGPTPTMPPLPGSPAIDAGLDSVTNFLATDQRGFPRRIGPHVDIGAVEYFSVSTIVTNTADSGAGSLRDAATDRTNGATITFAPALSGQTNILNSGQVTISVPLTIDASALPGGFKISGNGSSRIFEVSAGKTLSLNSLTLMNGYAGSGGSGGAILVDGGGALTLNNATVSGSSASGIGGGIGNFGGVVNINNSALSGNAGNFAAAIENDGGTVIIDASTLSGNVATNNGGAIDNDAGAMLLINNSTFSGNSAGDGGGGLENYQATATLNNSTLSGNFASAIGGGINNQGTLALTNTIVAGNTSAAFPDLHLDVSSSFTGLDNITNGTPLLAALGNYGGPTQTMPPLSGSPAIDAGSDSATNFLATDQLGHPRLSGAHVDIGAVELQFVAANPGNPPALKNPFWSSIGGSNTFRFTFTNVSSADFTALTTTNLALPLTNWTVLGNIPEISPGQFQFTDPGATNSRQRFYKVVSP